MPKEYRTIQEVAGPLMLVRGVENVAYDELGEIELASGETRRCKVLEINGSDALVQLFESSTGINLSNSKVRFLGHSMELGVSGDMLGRVFDGMGRPIDDGPQMVNNNSGVGIGMDEETEEPAEGASKKNKVVNIHATTQLKVVLVKPERFEDASTIADHLNNKRTVVLNLESTNKEVSRRLVDFLSGVAYANNGQIKRVANSTFIITPYNVDIMGDLLDELENNGAFY